ncbi:MAG: class I SAM-dependent methyltransferase [Gammaproteobacteria bacterium]|nr:class I SAM-dependent methyltransferase [Gammaproteobacteria bacterium]MYD02395.1 class I SAM-dependent methyltransferase [Gammaproteobacteria bacterium]MYI24859.1 class I SAM-dependent methyltransferase [Gammaproteobacteria bacterium]
MVNGREKIDLPASIWRRPVQRRLARLENGRLELLEAGQRVVLGGQRDSGDLPLATFEVLDSDCWRAIAMGGALGAAESYMDGHWRSPDLAGLLRLMLRDQDVLEGLGGPLSALGSIPRGIGHALRRNTRSGSRRNISAHYDVGNDFFQLFLDPTMLYSCAFFPSEDASLEEASIAKLDRLCEMLQLKPGLQVLEIGSGWGACAIHLARKYGCRVVSITISERQHAEAVQRVKAAGLEDRVEIRMQDYRDTGGQFDRLISIEMIEAVGAQYLDLFFNRCSELLKPDGLMALQAITITDQAYRAAVKRVDFIKRYIFPGGFLPSVEAIMGAVRRRTDFRLVRMEDIGSHYVHTLRLWAEALRRNWDAAKELGYSSEFLRMYEFYFRYCEAGFAERTIGDSQMLFAKPGAHC